MTDDGIIKSASEPNEPQQNSMSSIEKNDPNFIQQRSESTIKQEYEARKDLLVQGTDPNVVNAISGYKPEEMPFIYKVPEHKVYHQVHDSAVDASLVEGSSEIWVATSDAIHNLSNENGQRDQIPEVIAQWRKSSIEGKISITRTEVKQIGNGAFVELEYENVSQMGQLDGDLVSISLSTPDKPFKPYGGPDRMAYKRVTAYKERETDLTGIPGATPLFDIKEPKWKFGFSCTSTTILNGLQEMENFGYFGLIESVKYNPEKAYRFTNLPMPKHSTDQMMLPPEKENQEELKKSIETSNLENLLGLSYNFMRELYVTNQSYIFKKEIVKNGIEMEIDGILKHPDKIWILNKYLDTVSPRTRFAFARALSAQSNQEGFFNWVNTEFMTSSELQKDVLLRNSQHLVLWLKRSGVSEYVIEEMLIRSLDVIKNPNSTQPKDDLYQILEHSLNGLSSSITERYVEYLGQKFLGTFLQ